MPTPTSRVTSPSSSDTAAATATRSASACEGVDREGGREGRRASAGGDGAGDTAIHRGCCDTAASQHGCGRASTRMARAGPAQQRSKRLLLYLLLLLPWTMQSLSSLSVRVTSRKPAMTPGLLSQNTTQFQLTTNSSWLRSCCCCCSCLTPCCCCCFCCAAVPGSWFTGSTAAAASSQCCCCCRHCCLAKGRGVRGTSRTSKERASGRRLRTISEYRFCSTCAYGKRRQHKQHRDTRRAELQRQQLMYMHVAPCQPGVMSPINQAPHPVLVGQAHARHTRTDTHAHIHNCQHFLRHTALQTNKAQGTLTPSSSISRGPLRLRLLSSASSCCLEVMMPTLSPSPDSTNTADGKLWTGLLERQAGRAGQRCS